MKSTSIGKIADVQTGPFGSQLHKEDYVLNGTPIVTVEHLGQKIFTTQNLPCVSDKDKERLAKYTMRPGDIIFSRVGSVDRCSYATVGNNGWLFSGRCLRLRVTDDGVESEYLYYYFCQEAIKELIRNHAVGATMPSLNTKLLSELPFTYPEKNEQKRVISLLSDIDAKIERNAQINRNLEKQAQAIFKSWFVDFEPFGSSIPSDWVEISFGAFLKPRSEKSNDVSIPLFSVTDTGIYPRDEKFNKKLSKSTTKNKIAYCTDIIFGMSREILNWGIMRAPIGCVSSAYNVYSVSDMVNSKYLESFIKSHSQSFQDLIGPASREGQGIDKAALLAKTIYLPTNDVLTNYYAIEDALTETIKIHESENKRLILLRDTLLPKLMSGEIDVSEVEV